jgi:hypothetical protein
VLSKDSAILLTKSHTFVWWYTFFYLFLRLMYQTIQHIESLLAKHHFVILPTIGGFVTSTQASYSKDDTLYPPCKALGFNPTLTYNDGLLAQSIAQTNACTIEQANTLIAEETSQIHQHIQQWGYLSCGKLGTLVRTTQGIGFEPATQGLPLAEAYGLQPIYFPQVEKKQPTVVAALPKQPTGKVVPLKRVRHNFAAACVAVILLLFMLPANLTHHQNQHRATFVPPVAFEEVVIMPQIQAEEETECTPYHVVIGSFHTQAKALKFLKELPSSLKHCQIVYSDHRFRIIAASYPTEELGNKGIEEIAKKHKAYKDAWLLHYNP